jgi:Family of unknown function (DUF6600)
MRKHISISKEEDVERKAASREERIMKAKKVISTQLKLWLGLLAITSLVLVGCGPTRVAGGVTATAEYGDYAFDELNSYGIWITVAPYGRVWRPNVDREWMPFYYGHWDYTKPGWTWVSYEPFGWIVYHYGNWVYAPDEGWVWIPGDGEWSPAVVEWMYYDDFVCWAPLPPRGVFWPRPWELYQSRFEVWHVVHARDFVSENVGEHRLPIVDVRPGDEHVQVVNHFPDVRMIEERSGKPVQTVNIARERVQAGKRTLERMQISQSDQERFERNRSNVERHVTRRSGDRRQR